MLNGLNVMNTWYEKKDIYMYTWQHPGSNIWHYIDYILMKQSQRIFCWDVSVFAWADCWTDNRIMQAKITLRYKLLVAKQHVGCCFTAYKLRDQDVGLAFNKEVVSRVNSMGNDDMSTQEK